MPVRGVFIYLQGAEPIVDFLKGQIETTLAGCMAVDREMATSGPGVFAVGDLLSLHVKQALMAADDGVMAAMAVSKYLHGREKAQPDWEVGCGFSMTRAVVGPGPRGLPIWR